MNKEEIKELARQSMIETIKTNLDSAMIFTYIKSLEDKIKNAIEEIDYLIGNCDLTDYQGQKIKNILRGEDNE